MCDPNVTEKKSIRSQLNKRGVHPLTFEMTKDPHDSVAASLYESNLVSGWAFVADSNREGAL